MYARAPPFIPPHLTAHIRTLSAATSRSASPSPAPATRFGSPAAPATRAAPAARAAPPFILPSQALGCQTAANYAVMQKHEIWICPPPRAATASVSAEERVMHSCDHCKKRKIKCKVQAAPGQRALEASGKCQTCIELQKQCTWNLANERIAREQEQAQERARQKRLTSTPTKPKRSSSSTPTTPKRSGARSTPTTPTTPTKRATGATPTTPTKRASGTTPKRKSSISDGVRRKSSSSCETRKPSPCDDAETL